MAYCKNCGKELPEGAKFCKHCGHTLGNGATSHKSSSPKKKMSKKQKIIFSIIGGVVLLLVIAFSILNYLSSPNQLMKSLSTAMEEQDYEKIGKMVVFADTDEEIGTENATAMVQKLEEERSTKNYLLQNLAQQAANKMAEHDTILNLTEGKCYLLLDCYKITAQPIYITTSSNLNDTVVHYHDNKTVTIEEKEDEIELGPFTYGEHVLKGEYDSNIRHLETEETIDLYDYQHTLDFYFDYDAIYIEDFVLNGDTTVLLNGDEIDESMYLDETQIGPLANDEEYTIEIQTEFPWGTLSTGEQEVSDYYVDQVNYQPTEELLDQVADDYSSFLDKLFEGIGSNNTEGFSFLSDATESEIVELIEDINNTVENWGYLYYIDLKEFSIANDAMKAFYDEELEEYVLQVFTKQEVAVENTRYNDTIDNPNYREEYGELVLRFNEDNWEVYDVRDDYSTSEHEYTKYEYKGDAVVIEDDGEKKDDSSADKEKTDGEAEEQITDATLSYIDMLVAAINAGDYSVVSEYIQAGSALDEAQQGLVKRLYDNGTMEEVIERKVTDVNKSGDKWKVSTKETIQIIYEDGEREEKDYNWTYTVVEDDGDYLLTDIE
ncbi:zinc-ribbon domain-containing protein [Gracilibacillus sp. S3-1-1]|uniref:Zinc-ribbon domain-containing protein n=1 Tax=Gracilibacillus pellucidus TaxID=3095368 RepID=A0ACC6M8P8_9BACI|nr:zinc-ribbon domain-containing protein [Gracilibacillus sp. S3-1-1]MDX8047227.1 zinc-ribbon domain-containing protein [Gracilibacillus sp. S3-1-1]